MASKHHSAVRLARASRPPVHHADCDPSLPGSRPSREDCCHLLQPLGQVRIESVRRVGGGDSGLETRPSGDLPDGTGQAGDRQPVDDLNVRSDVVSHHVVACPDFVSRRAAVETYQVDCGQVVAVQPEPMDGGRRDAGERDGSALAGQRGPGEDEMPADVVAGVVDVGRGVRAVPDVSKNTRSTGGRELPIGVTVVQASARVKKPPLRAATPSSNASMAGVCGSRPPHAARPESCGRRTFLVGACGQFRLAPVKSTPAVPGKLSLHPSSFGATVPVSHVRMGNRKGAAASGAGGQNQRIGLVTRPLSQTIRCRWQPVE